MVIRPFSISPGYYAIARACVIERVYRFLSARCAHGGEASGDLSKKEGTMFDVTGRRAQNATVGHVDWVFRAGNVQISRVKERISNCHCCANAIVHFSTTVSAI
jgi:hypothetical protein